MATEILVFQMKSDYCVFFGLLTLYEHYSCLQTLRCSDWWRNHEGVFCHPLNHSPSNSKEKTTRQTENHSQFFRRNGIYTPVHILWPFDFCDGFKSWFWNWVKCYGHYLLVYKWPILRPVLYPDFISIFILILSWFYVDKMSF